MHEATAQRLPTALRLALLSFAVAAAWLLLSFVVTTSSAFAQATGDGADPAHDTDPTVHSILKSVTDPVLDIVEPTVNTVEVVAIAPVQKALERAKSTPLGGFVDGAVTDLTKTVVDALPTPLTDLLEDIADEVAGVVDDVGDTSIALVETLAVSPRGTATAVTLAEGANGLHGHDTESLSSLPEPWTPTALALVSSTATASASASAGAAAASDLPSTRSGATIDAGGIARALGDDIPGSPTFATDCTPD